VIIHTQSDLRVVGERCAVIDGDLRIAATSLTTLDGLEGVREAHYVVISKNRELASIAGLCGLVRARGVTVLENPALESLSGLEHLEQLEAAVIVGNGVTTLAGLEGLDSVGELVISNNPRLVNLDGLHATARVANVEANGARASDATPTAVRAGAVPPNG
jgi:hypothetical protein